MQHYYFAELTFAVSATELWLIHISVVFRRHIHLLGDQAVRPEENGSAKSKSQTKQTISDLAKMPRLIPLLCILAMVLSASACTCPEISLPDSYARAKTVVRARVLSVTVLPTPTPPACLTGVPRCLIPIRLYQPVKYAFMLQGVFKGCGPKSRPIFYGMTATNSAACGVRLKKRKSYVLFVDVERPCPLDGFNKDAFSLNLCQYNRLWKSLEKREKKFLKKSSRKKENQCIHAWPTLRAISGCYCNLFLHMRIIQYAFWRLINFILSLQGCPTAAFKSRLSLSSLQPFRLLWALKHAFLFA